MNSMRTLTSGELAFTDELAKRFSLYADISESSQKQYNTYVGYFFNWMIENNITAPTKEDILAYKAWLSKAGLATSTARIRYQAVKLFFGWLSSAGLYPNITNGVKGVKCNCDNNKKDAFTPEEIITILDSIDTTTIIGKRNYCLISLAVTCGLREIEICRANVGDIEKRGKIHVLWVQGKGHTEKDAQVNLPDEVYDMIAEYLAMRDKYTAYDAIFVSHSNRTEGCRLSANCLSRIYKSIFRAAGFDSAKLTGHSLRHTANTTLLETGADLYEVQQFARHRNPVTTEIYLHQKDVNSKRHQQAVYNAIFNDDGIDYQQKIQTIVAGMTVEQQKNLYEYLMRA